MDMMSPSKPGDIEDTRVKAPVSSGKESDDGLDALLKGSKDDYTPSIDVMQDTDGPLSKLVKLILYAWFMH